MSLQAEGHVEVKIDFFGGACPTQAEGVIVHEGVEYPFYFRYRWDRVEMYIWEPGHQREFFDQTHELAHYEQRDVTGIEANGFMGDVQVEELIHLWAVEFAQSRSS